MKDNVELVNKQLKDEFEKNRNYFNLERYVMSELLSPIQDYENAIKIIKSNMNLISDLKLIYIGAYLSSECFQRDNEFLKMLNGNITNLPDNDKSIIYYLNAINSEYKSPEYIKYLKLSVNYAKDMKFVNCYKYLANVSPDKSKELYKKALENIVIVYTIQELKNASIDFYLSAQRYIEEYILGTKITDTIFNIIKNYNKNTK